MSELSTAKTSVHQLFQEAITLGLQESLADCCARFAYWEVARNYVDDPSHPAKAAIQWIYAMEDLRAALSEFKGDRAFACLAALDRAYEEFCRLDHSSELIHGISAWIEHQLSERS
ncbi:MAG: hypothetical protein RH917_16920 [Lacipirellulaceae bacterium]